MWGSAVILLPGLQNVVRYIWISNERRVHLQWKYASINIWGILILKIHPLFIWISNLTGYTIFLFAKYVIFSKNYERNWTLSSSYLLDQRITNENWVFVTSFFKLNSSNVWYGLCRRRVNDFLHRSYYVVTICIGFCYVAKAREKNKTKEEKTTHPFQSKLI